MVDVAVPLLRRGFFGAGPSNGGSNVRPFEVFSRPCLRGRGDDRDVHAVSSSSMSSFVEMVD